MSYLYRIISYALVGIICYELTTIIGENLFGAPFWNGQFDKWDFGFYCGAFMVIALRFVDDVHDLFELN